MTWTAKMNGCNTPKSINGRTNFNVSKVNGMRGFIPTDIGSNLKVWIAPDTEAYSNGASVSTAHDRSGGGLDYAQPTGADQPTFQVSGINTRKAFAFNGAQILLGPAGTLTLAQNVAAVTILAVATSQNATAVIFGVSSGTGANSSRASIGFAAGNLTANRARRLDADAVAMVNTASGASQTFSGVYDYASNLLTPYLNGVAGTTSTFPSGAGNTSNTASLSSAIGGLGTSLAGASPFTGSIGDLVFVLGVPTAATLTYLQKYLMAKYGTGGYT